MSVLGINFLNVSITALVVIYVFVCFAMIMLVLMQRPKQEGLGAAFGANTTDQLFGARTTNVLQKGTVYLAVLFFVLTLALAMLVQKKNKINSLAKAPETAAEVAPADVPVKSLSEELPGNTSAPVTVKPGETTTVDVVAPPAGDKPAEQPAGDKPAEQPAGDKPAEQPAGDKPTEQPAEPDKTPPQ